MGMQTLVAIMSMGMLIRLRLRKVQGLIRVRVQVVRRCRRGRCPRVQAICEDDRLECSVVGVQGSRVLKGGRDKIV